MLNTSRSNHCITVRDDATVSSYLSAHFLQIFIFSSAGGIWRLACICESLSLISRPSLYFVLMRMGITGSLVFLGISTFPFSAQYSCSQI